MDIQGLQRAFENKGYSFRYFEKTEEAALYLDGAIDGKTVGFGDSQTLYDMRIYEALKLHNSVVSPMHPENGEGFDELAGKCVQTQIYLLSANAVTEQGEMVNIDGYGNRISCSLFGHEKVYFVLGINKLVSDLESAVARARNIAAPQNAKRLGKNTPCALKGDRCYNCNSADRICNAMVVHLRKMSRCEAEVIVIGQNLGL